MLGNINIRLTTKEINSIKDVFFDIFKNGSIYLFGSRVDDTKRGGDIDLYILLSNKLSYKEILNKKTKFKIKLYELIGEQKIDIVISEDKNRSI
ncbi:MAG: nucleotidyltransferase domain-containing protein [Campylobacterota bacterium]|nr:nucleotidyltransferase domain-containing protein [Campylobacterota bacterium]